MPPTLGQQAPLRMRNENQRPPRFRAAVVLAMACSWACAGPPLARGATGTLSRSAGAGLTLSVDTRWLDGGGYRPVRLEFTPVAPTTADRTMSVTFRARRFGYQARQVIVTQNIEIPAGVASVTATLSVPQQFFWQEADCEVFEDGRYLKTLSQTSLGIGAWNQAWSEGLPNILLLAPSAPAGFIPPGGIATPATILANPDSSVLSAVLPVQQYRMNGSYAIPAQPSGGPPLYQYESLVTAPPEHLPPRWLDYTSVDLLLAPWTELKELPSEQPQAWRAIREWTHSGGNLMVFGVGADFDALQDLETQLAWRDEPPGGADPLARGWEQPSPARFGSLVDPPYGFQNQAAGYPMGVDYAAGAVETVEFPTPEGALPVAPPTGPPGLPASPTFLTRRYGMGMVVAMKSTAPFTDPPEHWAWLLNTLGSERWLWYRRFGVSLERENDAFWEWLVPGVGLAPVTEFRLLITVFVLLIGPVNYYWLRRQGRLHLLLMIVPACAATITLGLFGYAVLADGLGVRARVRSYTLIDQARGEAACWSRVSYYAGLAPLGGLEMPPEQAVIPVEPRQDGRSTENRRRVHWLEDEQNLASGWLASRTPAQAVNVVSRPSSHGVDFLPANEGQTPRVANRLQTRIERLLLADEQGACYRAAEVPEGATVELLPADPNAELLEFRKRIAARAPAMPDGMAISQYSSVFGFSSRRWYRNYSAGLPPAQIATGRLERSIQEVMLDPGFSQPTSGGPEWKVGAAFGRRWIAIVDRSPEVDVGVSSYRDEGGLHVVRGRW